MEKIDTSDIPEAGEDFFKKAKLIKPTAEERQKMMADHAEKVLAAPRRIDKTALSYWFPLIEAAGMPVPKTIIVPMPVAAQEAVWLGLDGKEPFDSQFGSFRTFADEIAAAAFKVGGFPFFLRTDHTSGKHQWKNTCFVEKPADIKAHIVALAEFSELCSLMGLPWDVFVVREFLPIIPHGVCPNYGNMPVNREFRYFVDDGVIRCRHPYWPDHALEDGGLNLKAMAYEDLCTPRTDEDTATIDRLAQQAGRTVGGSWSIDILETKRGWFVTDMAEAHKSFHWEGCPHEAAPEAR